MRTLALIAVPLLLALPTAAGAQRSAGNGTLSVEGGTGSVVVDANGAVIGRLETGVLRIEDPAPGDGVAPTVRGGKRRKVSATVTTWRGSGIRFSITNGRFNVRASGSGINLSAVGRGRVMLQGIPTLELGLNDGVFSLNGAEPRSLPDLPTWLQLRPAPRPTQRPQQRVAQRGG